MMSPQKSRSTMSLSSFRLKERPMAAPITANTTMQIKRIQEKSGTDPVSRVCRKPEICENIMIKREFWAAVFVSMEKKKERKTRLKGPPPIPRKEEKKAQNNTNDNAHDRMRHAMGPDRVFFNGVDQCAKGKEKKNGRLACSDPVRIRA